MQDPTSAHEANFLGLRLLANRRGINQEGNQRGGILTSKPAHSILKRTDEVPTFMDPAVEAGLRKQRAEGSCMSSDRPLLERYQIAVYFVIVFILSWGAILLFLGLDALPVAAAQAQQIGMALLLGPAGAMVILTALIDGKAGFRRFGARLKNFRIGGRYYAVALLTAPVTAMATLLVLSIFDPQFMPKIIVEDGRAKLILVGIGAGLFIAFFEESGWTGFAVPRLLEKRGVVFSGAVTGLLWGLWHFPPFWQADSFSAAFPFFLLLSRLFSWIVAYRVLMVWLYRRTESLPGVILMHMSLVVCMIAIEPPLQGTALLTYILAWTVVLWAIIGIGGLVVRHTGGDAERGRT